MSDNLSGDLCEREMNVIFVAPELWAEIFKFLPLRALVERVQPATKAFKANCDRNVKTVHVINMAQEFLRKLKAGDTDANKQVDDLSCHNCALAGQFVIDGKSLWIYINNGESQTIQTVLRHSLDLFQQCQIATESKQLVSAEQLDYLTVFGPAKPVFIHVHIYQESTEASLSTLLGHPTVLNCSRLELIQLVPTRDHCQPIFDWLHHNPMDMGVDLDSNSSCINVVDQQQQQQQQPDIRALILTCCCFDKVQTESMDWLLERCVQHFRQSQNPSDRRHFLLAFRCFEHVYELLNRFTRIENPSTGEVLLLKQSAEDVFDSRYYRLVRCLASQIADGTGQLYAKLFTSPEDEQQQFKIGDQHGKEPLKVFIEEKQERDMDDPSHSWSVSCHCGIGEE